MAEMGHSLPKKLVCDMSAYPSIATTEWILPDVSNVPTATSVRRRSIMLGLKRVLDKTERGCKTTPKQKERRKR